MGHGEGDEAPRARNHGGAHRSGEIGGEEGARAGGVNGGERARVCGGERGRPGADKGVRGGTVGHGARGWPARVPRMDAGGDDPCVRVARSKTEEGEGG